MSTAKKSITINGLVTPTEWDHMGNPISIKICTDGEVDYHVIKDKKGERLFNHIKNFVTVNGTVTNNKDTNNINVKSILKEKK